jgi:hypothetical protein
MRHDMTARRNVATVRMTRNRSVMKRLRLVKHGNVAEIIAFSSEGNRLAIKKARPSTPKWGGANVLRRFMIKPIDAARRLCFPGARH